MKSMVTLYFSCIQSLSEEKNTERVRVYSVVESKDKKKVL